MGANTPIEWATHTLNFWEGCTKVSEGCLNCYAADRDRRFHAGAHWGPGAPRRLTGVSTWAQADKWNREAEASGIRPRVFVNSLSDILDPEVPVAWLGTALQRMDETPCNDYLLVTKRPQLWRERLEQVAAVECGGVAGVGAKVAARWLAGHAPANIWMGTTVENQPRADERVPALLAIPARVHFLSAEPLLGGVDLTRVDPDPMGETDALRGATFCDGRNEPATHARVDWVICGGESGKGARPMHPDWARSLRDQCAAAGVAFFFKQWGVWAPHYAAEHETHGCDDGCRLVCPETGEISDEAPADGEHEFMWPHRKKQTSGRLLDGVEHNAIPEARR